MNFFVVTLFSFFIAVQASPLLAPRAAFDVYSPPIISPNSTSKLCAGQITDVIWNATNPTPPSDISNGAIVQLNYVNGTLIILRTDFNLRDGSVKVTIPVDTPPGRHYTITLFGDSGNRSQEFRIINCLNDLMIPPIL